MPESRKFSAERVIRAVRDRSNPIRGLTPQILVTWIEQWRCGYLRPLALLWEEIADRDMVLKGVIAKRQRAASRCPWEVIAEDQSEEATAQREFLEDFYCRLSASSVMEQDTCGGVALLLRQMMDAVGRRYSIHEILWRPGRDGSLTAHLIHAPLHFFETRTGRLRYLEADHQLDGAEMRDREWMVTTSDGLMMASCIAYIAKDLAWKDWLNYSERFGQPIIDAATDATDGSKEWDALKDALTNLQADGFILRNRAATITLMESKGTGGQPQPGLVEYVDRGMASLWRGGDLSTLSAGNGQGQGASLQGNESSDLTADDCELLTETLNQRLDLPALQWKFGRDVKPLAQFRVRPAARRGASEDVAIDRFLREAGFPLGVSDTAERYGRVVPDDDEPVLGPVQAPSAPGTQPPPYTGDQTQPAEDSELTNPADPSLTEDQVRNAQINGDPAIIANVAEAQRDAIKAAFERDLQPLRDRLNAILTIEDPALFAEKLRALREEAPALLRDLGADPSAARELEVVLSGAMLDGLTAKAARRP